MEIAANHIEVAFGSKSVLSDLNFSVNDGGAVFVQGENGAGKTTLLKLISGLVPARSGEIHISGARVRSIPSNIRIGVFFREPMLYAELTARENVFLFGRLLGISLDVLGDALKRFGVEDFQSNYPAECSEGMVSRIALTRAFLGDPKLLVLDEPWALLDSDAREVLDIAIHQHLDRGGMLFFSSHVKVSDALVKRSTPLHLGHRKEPGIVSRGHDAAVC